MGLEALLIVLNVGLFAAQVVAWRWVRRVQLQLRGGVGYELVRIIAWIFALTLVGRVLGVAIVTLVGIDPGNIDIALVLTFVSQLFTAGVFVWGAYQILRLGKDDSDLEATRAEGG